MAYFRLYFFNARGQIRQFREFEAISDTVAATMAEGWRGLAAMELWSGKRKVKRWDAPGLSPEAMARSAVSAVRTSFGGPLEIDRRSVCFPRV